jgi:hypothetical protein
MMRTWRRTAPVLAALLLVVSPAPAQTHTWTQTGSGAFSWNDAANWAGGVPNGNQDTAAFSAAGAGATKTVTVTGTITVAQLQINATQSSPLTISGGTILLRSVGGGGTLAPITVDGTATPVTHTISSTIDFDGSTGTRLISVGPNATLNLSGPFVSAAGGSYLVTGGGTTVLSGNNPGFTANVTTAGSGTTLSVTGTIGSAVTVSAGTTLTGTGTITSSVTVNGTAGVAGTLNMGSLTLGTGAVNYTSVVGGAPASPVNDKVTIGGPLTATAGTALNFTLVNDGTLVPGGTYTITVLDATSISGLTAGQVTVTASNFAFLGTPVASIDGVKGDVTLTFMVVPEPATALGAAAVGLGGGLWLRRRRAARRAAAHTSVAIPVGN